MAGVAGLFGPDGPHPFGAALRALAQQITWTAWPRHATRDSSHITEPCGRYPALRGSVLEQHSTATNNPGRNIWLGWLDYSAGRPHPFGAALRALAQQITWTAWPRHATRGSSHFTEPYGRYPALRGSILEQHSAATNYSNRNIWLGWLDSNQRMAGSKPAALPLGDTPTKKIFRPRTARILPVAAPATRAHSSLPRQITPAIAPPPAKHSTPAPQTPATDQAPARQRAPPQ